MDGEPARATLVDSNVLLDILGTHGEWTEWSMRALNTAANDGELIVNPIVLAEIAVRFETIEALDAAVPADTFRREQLPWSASFLAGKAFEQYRARGGPRTTLLPDILIGAHAAVGRMRVLTRDPRRFRTCFPRLTVIAPDT